jgi:hypothetical protein
MITSPTALPMQAAVVSPVDRIAELGGLHARSTLAISRTPLCGQARGAALVAPSGPFHPVYRLAFYGSGHVEFVTAWWHTTFGAQQTGTRVGWHGWSGWWAPTMFFRVI